MPLTDLASPSELRTSAARAAATYAQIASTRLDDPVVATSAQHLSDVSRVIGALWLKAGNSPDPAATFFRLADTAASTAFSVSAIPGLPPAGAVNASREAWSGALASMNVPLYFPESALPNASTPGWSAPPDWAGARSRHLYAMDSTAFVAARREQAATLTGPAGVLAGVDAYLVEAAEAAGDMALVTVHARWAWVEAVVHPETTLEDAIQIVFRYILGPIEARRAAPYVPAVTA